MGEILDRIKAIKKQVKNGKLRIQRKNVKDQIMQDIGPRDFNREKICRDARKKAHTAIADVKRDMSNEIRNNSHTLSEGYDFIEESCGSGMPEFTFYEEPQISESISEAFADDNKYKMIGVAEGVFAPIGVMSRNNRMYDNDHYDYLLENQMLVDKIANRGMLGTIGHHDKRVDDDDLALGKVSHIVTDLHIQEEADGSRNLVGRLEILNTPAGNLLKTYYDSGMPLYVSSRGAGRLLPVANESYKRVDKTNYYLETFDIVRDPGFLGAKPKYVSEGLEDKEVSENNINGDIDMGKEKVTPAISAEMETKEIVDKMLNPLQEQLAELADTVKMLADKILVEEVVEEPVQEECEACPEPEKETEPCEKEEKAPVAEEVSEEKEEKDEAEDAKEDEAKAEELKADAEEDREDAEEIKEEAEVVSEEKRDEEAEKLEADAEDDEAKAEKLEKDAEEDKEDEKVDEANEAEEKAEEAEAEAEKAEEEAERAEEKAEEAEEIEEAVSEEKEEEKEAKEAEEETKEEAAEKVTEECGEECCDPEEKERKREHLEHHIEAAVEKAIEDKKEEDKKVDEDLEEQKVITQDLLKLVEEATAKSKDILEQYNAVVGELNAYKLSEEFSITVDEAKAKLQESSIEAIREELAKAEETPVEKEEPAEEAEKEEKAPVAESKKATKGVFTRFSSLHESKSNKKGFSVFNF